MTEESKPQKAEKPVENLELNRETIQDLNESEAERVGGGVANADARGPSWPVCLCIPGTIVCSV
jgi:hypothetical protein